MATQDTTEKKDVYAEFKEVVNMTPAAIEKWLDTPESKKVGQKSDGSSESTGHQSGKKIIEILHKKQANLTDDDYAHMHKVISYVRRHSAQKPAEVDGSNWLYSLKNWGHDPQKK
ncbi:DUF3140 domain-containing protein [Fibrella sp. HMF5335]|uniref:DUF3140 domain-containing protein n=1 Tax=Fibrella rubiginis TaxID=2817060 RepID=A0A939GG62_9BACT|nr:DUF3140 domain-containing protein [Fibrella rubiginis]MBO0935838.1 DUF3140 domain-containing protein [Fibrella rubiginis]